MGVLRVGGLGWRIHAACAAVVFGLTLTSSASAVVDVPQIVQTGRSGCVPAVFARVFAYYGKGRCGKAHDAATAEAAADLENLRRRFGACEGWGVRPEDVLRIGAAVAAERGLVLKRELLRPQIDEPDLTPARLRALRPAAGAAYSNFVAYVRAKTEAGIPVFQGVTLGILPEADGRHREGAHLRLVVGLSEDGAQVLYSDTWRSATAVKRLPTADAWAMTELLFTLEAVAKPAQST